MKRVNWLGNAALGLLLVLDVVLVGLVFSHQGKADASGTTAAAITPSPSATTPAPTTTSSEAPRPTLAAGLLSVVDARTAWAATKGTCARGGAEISRTTDGGATWAVTKAQPYGALTRIDATSAQAAFVVGAGTSCAVAVRRTTAGGDSWRPPASVSSSWALDLADASRLHVTTGATSTPCGSGKITAFARISDTEAAVLCADDSTRSTGDAARTWTKGPSLASVDGVGDVVALAAVGSGTKSSLVVAASSTDCAGVQIVVSTAGKAFARTACVATVKATGPGANGTVPVAFSRQGDNQGTLWLLAGTTLTRSTGGFTAWSKAS